MKKVSVSIAMILVLFLAQRSMAGDPVKLDPFHSIYVSSEVNAELVLSDEEQLEVNFEDAPEENLIVEVVDSVLRLRMKTGRYKDAKLNVRVHYKRDLKMMEANGRAQIWSEEANVREMMNLLLVIYISIIGVLIFFMNRLERALKIPGYSA